ncbi:MAG: DNA polymerase III subunit alpha [Alphaproteobacteria bacterium]|nr:DNA polymerase III subunit alpha [Alphaproteobacteria bacterium]
MSGFVHLRTHSAYSLLKGALKIPKLIALSKQYAMPAVALTDHDNLFGSLEFSMAAVKEGIQPIIGCTLSLVPYGVDQSNNASLRQAPDQLLVYAKDDKGYHNLLSLTSDAYLDPALAQSPLLSYEQLAAHSEGLIALTGSIHGGLGKMLLSSRKAVADKFIAQLREMFGDRLYIELTRHRIPEEKMIERGQIDMAIENNIPLVATNNVYFSDADMFEAHDALMCVSDGRFVMESDRPRLNPEHRFKSAQEMRLLFRDIPEAIENTLNIAQRCHIFSPSRAPILPGFHMTNSAGEVLSESDALREKARAGLEERLKAHVYKEGMSEAEREAAAKPYRDRLEFELDVIITMKFPGYFLIVSDFITWAKENGIPVGPGRGSGAGSVVAWVLLITDLDPLRFGLIFERFLNPERISMPDFDIDFCQDRRDEVIRYVQQKYGNDRVAQIITFGKLQARAVLRDVGRVLQMPYSQVDRICKLVPNNPAAPVTLEEAVKLEPLLKQAIREDESVEKLVNLSLKLEGLYRHASTHAAGVVIADRPLKELVPLYRDAKSEMLVVQYSMKYAEEAGLVKFDFLGLRTLTIIQKAVALIKKRGIDIDISKIPLDDKATFKLLTKADTLGVFQFESAGMQDALRKLKPDCLEDLIALGALYRPGPMDNIPMYIARKHGKEKPDYLHPLLTEVLKETYGVIIYQEQVQKIAQVLAGYTLGAADLLRRAMGKKIKAEMDAQRATFVEGAKKNGVSQEQATNIFNLVDKFAGYGFNKSHAAAYAVVSYQTAYLKANYPVEFIAASMTYEMGSTDKLGQFRQEAQKFGIDLLPPDINKSEVEFSVEKQEGEKLAIRYALAALKNVGAAAMGALVDERSQDMFKDIFDFASRVDGAVLNRRQLESLVMAGCFDGLHTHRRPLFESIDKLIATANHATQERESSQISLFGGDASPQQNHVLPATDEWPMLEKLNHECAALGFYLSSHPLEGYAPAFKRMGVVSSASFIKQLTSQYRPVKLAGIVTGSKIKVSPRGRFAFVQLSDAEGNFEVSIFDAELLNSSHELLTSGTAVLIHADGKADENGARLIAQKLEKLDAVAQDVKAQSLIVTIGDVNEISKLKTLLNVAPKGAKVKVIVPLVEGDVHIELAEQYDIPTTVLQAIYALPNITAEAA